MTMSMTKDQLSVEVAKLYYQLEYGQQQIATELNISRPTVSRLLKHAKDRGFVTITITDPFSETAVLANTIKEKYGLSEVRIAQTPSDNYDLIIEQISLEAANLLGESIIEGDIIGIGWGTTIYEVAKKLQPSNLPNIQVVQLKGSITHSKVNTYAHETLSMFADNYHTTGTALPLPVIFDNKEVKTVVEKDRHIQHVMKLQEDSSVAIYTVGTTREEALVFQLGYLSDEQKNQLQQTAVGDICSRFYDASGKIASEEINARTIGIELSDLPNKRLSILVAGGNHKFEAVKGALRGNYVNTLVTDYWLAKKLANEN
ncbi:sugar-binding transcriptional regulator [Vagococcus carniphilus]|uniref:sugar-binding transcriptional regulator n=1 Tax=Vagococcus carniphilus TaxID=218144 RepID=UPI00288E67D4|nr:sugar-binding transcriptional regulator [Vagococcus carniphilus]MDT2814191.1 sugar-binding transcriptional regulator [Vagococcus carniphilus]MDT2849063.1 sugar-binding transcriptional regulator [Vagococcus carniphilus]